MFDSSSPPLVHQRAQGDARVALLSRGGATRLATLRQQGCAKAFLPDVAPSTPEVVFLNTSGGLTDGDSLTYALDLGPGCNAVATTQTAERAYARRAGAAPARMRVAIDVGAGARLDWLPQETILYDKCSLERETRITLAAEASVLTCESLVLGRAAMGERVSQLHLHDRRVILREGRPVMIDAVALDDATMAERDNAAGLQGARAVALLAFVAPGAEDAAESLRADIAGLQDVSAAISGWDGRCLIRLMAADGWPLRVALAALVRRLRGREDALPRVWQI